MGIFDSLSSLGSSVGNWMSDPANQDKMNAWGQELYALGNPGAKIDTGAIYSNYKKHQQQSMGNAAVAPDPYASAVAATPAAPTLAPTAPAAAPPLQFIQSPQIASVPPPQPYAGMIPGQALPSLGANGNPIRLTLPTMKLGGY